MLQIFLCPRYFCFAVLNSFSHLSTCISAILRKSFPTQKLFKYSLFPSSILFFRFEKTSELKWDLSLVTGGE